MKEKILSEIKTINRVGIYELEKFLIESDFFKAPASGEYHLSEVGGLAQHSWNVYEALKPIAKRHVESPDVTMDSLKICGLFHDICKVNFYKPDTRNKKIDGKWEAIPFFSIDDQDPLGHGEKSVIILSRFLRLTQDEAWAIRWHMGAWEAEGYAARKTLNAAIDKCPLLRALILADQFATFFIECKKD